MSKSAVPVFLALVLALALPGCGEPVPTPPAETIPLFRDVTLHFTPDDSTAFDSPFASARDKGRIMATYREFPVRSGPARVTLALAVDPIRKDIRNMHDRWDRAGWVRLVKPGMAPVELCRFMTAYGGAIRHEVDVTRVLPLLEGHCEFEVFIDTWVSPAWTVDVDLIIEPMRHGGVDAPAWTAGLLFPEGGLTAERPETTTTVTVPAGTRWTEVALISTGHCTDGTDADEFITKDNVLLIDGQEVHRWRPWRDDCTAFRAVNPYCAKWADGSWSSDYARSGWCPGDVALPETVDVSRWLTPGEHTVTFRVEDIRPRNEEDHHGYWRISAAASGWR
ncbi:MAG: peptide-N-glycosidase F-related protein [bacterium]